MTSKSLRRTAASVSVAVTVALILAACGSSGSSSTGGGSGGTSSLSPSSWLYVGPVTDADYNAAHYAAQKVIGAQFGLKTNYEDNVSVADVERLATQNIATGSKTVVLTSSSWITNVTDLAKKNASVDFIGFNGDPAAPPGQPKNLWLMGLNFYDAEYVLGVLAGEQTKTNTIGYIAGLKIPGLIAGSNGYLAGACSVNPKVKLVPVVVGSFDDATLAREATAAAIQKNVDVMQNHLNAGIPGVVQAISAASRPVYWTGLNTDKHALDPKHYLGSAEVNFSSGYARVFTAIKGGTRSGWFNLANSFHLSQLYNVSSAAKSKATTALQKVLTGTVHVPIDTAGFKTSCS